MRLYTTITGPLGELLVTGKRTAAARGGVALVSVAFPGQARAFGVRPEWRRDDDAFTEVRRRFREYFAGERTGFGLDLAAGGTAFQQRVWAALEAIPYGETTTYGTLTGRVGEPRDRVRAVAAAVGANPLLIVRPCHRVVGADGALTGYAGGIERKRHLLDHEAAQQTLPV
ncbi:cysteine methyltransferase [Spongiactinospora gelatinilytica]|uniref:methylated-DNA--[protein]-cysteine S-methyltransferase n=1 Tax=Spongiactinospora gelatinilytica TaxID=2666298 RepID=A0A2W2GW63_9ACTN|nr:methylated-DNA--[protein]-cysteine S-methyltransferase [Spongiactinospora gelatinilytica]PZG52182.1 cysteine methyltransferase [Spongiactinospora gelatinilytica]